MTKYTIPKMEMIECGRCTILSSSIIQHCSDWCKHWHSCRDRSTGKLCNDFVMK